MQKYRMAKKTLHYLMIVSIFLLALILLLYGTLNTITMQKYLDQCATNSLDIKIDNEGFLLGTIIGCPAIKEVYQLVIFSLVAGIVLFAIGLYEQYRYEIKLWKR